MRLLVLSILFAAASVAIAADTPSLNGKWKLHVSVAGNESDSDCTFAQKETELTGTCVSNAGSAQLTGKVDGTKVNWTYKVDYQGSPLTLIYKGTVEAEKISGTLSVVEFNIDGEFSAALSK